MFIDPSIIKLSHNKNELITVVNLIKFTCMFNCLPTYQ